MKIVILGGGLAGLAAAYKLCRSNEVIILEKDSVLGGMAASYHIDGYYIEKYYHHIFKSDAAILQLIEELGLGGRLEWLRGSTGYFVDGKAYPMNTPFEILRFPPLSSADIIRLGILVMRAKLIKDRAPYDNIKASDWIRKVAGNSVYENFFAPLLESKFGSNSSLVSAAWLLGRVQIRSNRGKDGEKLGYMRGGFDVLVQAVENSIVRAGGIIRTNCPASKILIEDNSVRGVFAGSKMIECDVVISTAAPDVLDALTEKQLGIHDKLAGIHYQGTACALFGLKKRLMDDVYWLNIKDDVPFGAVIEHTNFLPLSDYEEHLVYATAYFQNKSDPLWKQSEETVIESYIAGLESMFPNFSRDDVKWTRMYRRLDTAPVYETGYMSKVLKAKTDVTGLYLAGMFSQPNYPERSMNGSIVAGFECSDAVEGIKR
ncbi:MAG: NAD(P)/FAD-dependent oxidoreductase [Methanosarcinaceae archaeon]|nr:NAD(P)/FAD-dependent oxidoreductase [Methanosarcinaceae archaeon]